MRRAALAIIALLVACTEPRVEAPFAGSAPILEPAEYEQWWRDIEACSGRTRPAHVTYYVVEASTFDADGVASWGAWQAAARRMTIVRAHLLDAGTVRHEMLHAVLPPFYGSPDDVAGMHPKIDACMSLVSGWQ
jgi:hypothetical protein